MADAPIPAPPARLSRGRAASVVGGRLVLIVALITGRLPGRQRRPAPPGGPGRRPGQGHRHEAGRRAAAAGGPARPGPDGRSSTPPTARPPWPAIWLDENRRVVPLTEHPHNGSATPSSPSRTTASSSTRGSTSGASSGGRRPTCARGHIAQGGSTLTQQLIKLTVTGNSRTIDRKLREAMYAVELERRCQEPDPRVLPEPGLLRRGRLRHRHRRPALLRRTSRSSSCPWPRRPRWPPPSPPPSGYKPTGQEGQHGPAELVLDRMQELGLRHRQGGGQGQEGEAQGRAVHAAPGRQPYFERYISRPAAERPQPTTRSLARRTPTAQAQGVPGRPEDPHHPPEPKQAMAGQGAVQGQMNQFGGDPAGALASVEPEHGPDRGPVRRARASRSPRSTWPPPRAAAGSSRGRR